MNEQWYSSNQPFLPLYCLINYELEPYLLIEEYYSGYFVIKLSSILPYYHDGFIDYGFSQISFFEHLRLRGFAMNLLGKAFLFSPFHER